MLHANSSGWQNVIPDSMAELPVDERKLGSFVQQIRQDPSRRDELIGLLREDASIYDGRGATSTARIRGWVLAAFEDVGLPATALPYVLAELESGLEPYLVAAAAKAIRGAENTDSFIASYLLTALLNVRACDDAVTFDALRPMWPAAHPTSASLEILASLRWLGPAAIHVRLDLEAARAKYASSWSVAVGKSLDKTIDALNLEPMRAPACCASQHRPTTDGDQSINDGDVRDMHLEDQEGHRLRFSEVFAGRPTIIAFFYTRCPNPNKCSLTITKLAKLQQLMDAGRLDGQIGIAAITYDPGYDVPGRLRTYGEARGVRFGDSVRMLRAPEQHDRLRTYFRLRVGYNGSIVNRHAIELFLMDSNGQITQSWSRVQWDPHDVLTTATALVSSPP